MQHAHAIPTQRLARPFYGLITLLHSYLGVTAAFLILQSGNWALAIGVVLLMALHIGMYWLNVCIQPRPRWWLFYYAIQTLLIIAIGVITRSWFNLPISVFETAIFCIMGEALGLWGNSRRALAIVAGYALLAILLTIVLLPQAAWYASLGGLLLNGGWILLVMVLFNQQLLERQRAVDLAEQLESANAQLAASAARISTLTIQNERQRMARELHDTLAQGVAGLILQLEAVTAHLAAQRNERAAMIIDQALVRARSTLSESRAVIDDLRAGTTPISEQVREHVEHFRQISGITCQLDMHVGTYRLPETSIAQALHILREALTNCAQHAKASMVTIHWLLEHDNLLLDVYDNGHGFDPQQSLAGHYGLAGMRERAQQIGGILTVDTSVRGTRIRLQIGGQHESDSGADR